jgi:EAL domain-containing protein (putative c-di-GMP-specific phosphodiesterase class I)
MLCLRVLQTLGDTGLAPHRLELEISESAMVGDIVSAKKALAAFHDAGVRIALDDFGTGNSSLNHLRECRFDRIKIDRQFVRSMADSDEDASFVRAIVGLSKALGIPVTAEGIESNRVIGPLIAEGCAEGQGFNFAEALPAGEALDFLAERSPLRSAG